MNGISPRKAELLAANRIRWEPGFNDSTFIGWLTVAAYLLAAALAWRAASRAAEAAKGFERAFWLLVCMALIFLAANKQLDLQVLVTDIGRHWAVQHDLYQQRRGFQKLFMIMVAIGIAAAGVAGWQATRQRDPALRMAVAGLALCGGYILIRAASFHHIDMLMRSTILGVRWNWAVELAGIAITGLAAWRYEPRQLKRASPLRR